MSLADYTDRRDNIKLELNRIGIDIHSDLFEWKITVKNWLYKYIYENKDFKTPDYWRSEIGNMNCTIGHYEIAKESLACGYNKILIIEDDAVFLKDVKLLHNIVKNTPHHDVCIYGGNPRVDYKERYKEKCANASDGYYKYDDIVLLGTDCYSINHDYMKYMVTQQENFFVPADAMTNRSKNEVQILGRNLERVAPATRICVQNFSYVHGGHYDIVGDTCGLHNNLVDLSQYNFD